MVDVHAHKLVPEHRVLEEGETEALLEEYDTERRSLPKIRVGDPALPAEAETGDVVEIVRDSRTTDRATVYRLVIE
jgi:DNA-directed RNA polymerase subunit H